VKRVAFATLGCKANQFDTYAVQDRVEQQTEFVDFDEHADVYVINTCTVTHRGDAEARKLIRRARRNNPHARVMVTGCYAQTQPDAVAAVEGVTDVVGNSHKHELADLITQSANAPLENRPPRVRVDELGFHHGIPEVGTLERVVGGTRAFVKIQDGCDYACSFCVITIARGANRSMPVQTVVRQIRELEALGVKEAVLTGVQIGRFGWDLRPRRTLAEALTEILESTQIPRLRLTSIDPREVTPALIELVAREPRLCPHLHVPIQSGDDAILMLMRRNYDRAFLRDLFSEIRRRIPDCLIGTDAIVGFPGEGPSEFDMTVSLVETWIDHVHVFSYSDRPGVRSAALPDKLHPDVIKRRSAFLRQLGRRRKQAFAARLLGTRQQVLVEAAGDGYAGYTPHYVLLPLLGDVTPNQLVDVEIARRGDGLVGRVV